MCAASQRPAIYLLVQGENKRKRETKSIKKVGENKKRKERIINIDSVPDERRSDDFRSVKIINQDFSLLTPAVGKGK